MEGLDNGKVWRVWYSIFSEGEGMNYRAVKMVKCSILGWFGHPQRMDESETIRVRRMKSVHVKRYPL